MATKRNTKTHLIKKPGVKLGMIVSAIVVIIAFIILSIWFTSKSLFDYNDHFILKNLKVQSGGWWEKHPEKVFKILKIKIGETNLFANDLSEMRKKLEAEPSIQKVSIFRTLPDKLKIEITERIPKAFLYNHKKGLIVDNEGYVMNAETCIDVDKSLPAITWYEKEKPVVGEIFHKILPALNLIEISSDKLKGVEFKIINLKDKYYDCQIYIPRSRKKYYILKINYKDLKYCLGYLNLYIKGNQFKSNSGIIDITNKYGNKYSITN